MGKRDEPKPQAPQQPFNNPFSALQAKREELPQGPAAHQPAPEKKAPQGPAKAVVRMERKGRGGKEVTVVEQLGLPPAQLERWCKELKQSLGCGGALEEDSIVLQGDHRERVKALLLERGVRKVAVG
jgi:translation initiation factor 1